MKTVEGNAFTTLGVVAAIVAVGCGDTINKCDSMAQMFGWMLVSLTLLVAALILCALGANAENKRADSERMKKLNRIPTHTNEWRDA